jgi:hypothetical protein
LDIAVNSSVILNWAAGLGLAAGFFTLGAGALTWWGNSVSTQERQATAEEQKAALKEQKNTLEKLYGYTVDTVSKKDPATEEFIRIREEQLQMERARITDNQTPKAVIQNAKNMADIETKLQKDKEDSQKGIQREFEKFCIPVLSLFLAEFKSQISGLEKEGLITKRFYAEKIDREWLFGNDHLLGSATIGEDTEISLRITPPKLTPLNYFGTQITVPPVTVLIVLDNNEIKIANQEDMARGQGWFVLKAEQINQEEERKRLIVEIQKVVSKSITNQVKVYLKKSGNKH